jgi:NAD(P)-dependent dehydrogenase (short-subunit alcohol dehydrogenase family)
MSVLITGATRGIGRALAQAQVAAGQSVIGTHRGAAPPPLPGVTWQPLDLADPASPGRLAAALGRRAIPLLVCNAGVYLEKGQRLDDPAAFDAALWAQTFAVNVTGVFLTVRALLPALLRAQSPRIAIIASQMGSQARAPGGAYIYRASKAAAVNLGRNLAADLRGRGIAVGIYHPGWVRTDMGGSGADLDAATAAAGLGARFAELTLADSGCFRAWDGRTIPF